MMLPRTRPIRFPHDRGVLLAFHLLLCQSPMTCATSQGGEVCILVSSGPTPDSANEGDYRGFAVTSAISPSRIVSEYGCQVRPSSQATVVLSPNQMGLVAMGM